MRFEGDPGPAASAQPLNRPRKGLAAEAPGWTWAAPSASLSAAASVHPPAAGSGGFRALEGQGARPSPDSEAAVREAVVEISDPGRTGEGVMPHAAVTSGRRTGS
jgi:hypothetical protein